MYTCYVEDRYSSNIDCSSYDTPSLKEISYAIIAAKKLNFRVTLRFYIDLKTKDWRCHLNPKSKKSFFKDLDQKYKDFAIFLEKEKVDTFIIGAELCQLTKKEFKHQWIDLITSIRKNYYGKITYGSNWGEVNGEREFEQISFWHALDFIGIDHYKPISDEKLTNGDLIFEDQKQFFKKYETIAYKYRKRIIFTEIGFPGASDGHREPFSWTMKGVSNQKRQALLYKETLKAISTMSMVEGIYIWRMDIQKSLSEKPFVNERGYELWGREAWDEIKNFF